MPDSVTPVTPILLHLVTTNKLEKLRVLRKRTKICSHRGCTISPRLMLTYQSLLREIGAL